jgi:acyl-CoA reductase-like NAD-dependent aldehyde dehydrogenase
MSLMSAGPNEKLATATDAEQALLAVAICEARNAFSGWTAMPFASRKAIVASALKKVEADTDELSGLFWLEPGGTLAEARWQIDLLTKAVGPAVLQMELPEKEQDAQPIKHITKRYLLGDAGDMAVLRNLLVILAFGKVLPALLAGDTVVLTASPMTPVTMLRMAEYLRELVPPGVFNFVTASNNFGFGTTSLPEFDLITFTRSADPVAPAAESPSDALAPKEEESITDPGRIASVVTTLLRNKLFGSIEAIPTIRKPGRHGLASALFEILSFQPTRMKTQVLVWRLARKASYTFPMFRSKA